MSKEWSVMERIVSISELERSEIHPTAVFHGEVDIAEGVSIGAYSVLTGPLRIEAGSAIGSHCIIGGAPEHRILSAVGCLTIGSRTIVRDGCIIHHGTSQQGTSIGCDCYIMSRAYIAHDCQIARCVSIAAGCSLGGHVCVQQGASLGMNATVHQYSTVGAWAMIGQSTPVTKDIPPFSVAARNPIKLLRINQVAIQRANLDVGKLSCDGQTIDYSAGSAMVRQLVQEFQNISTRKKLFEPILPFQSSRKPR